MQPAADGSYVPSEIRLVEGLEVREGSLQLKYEGRWRGVCSNGQNWTRTDAQVACRQLGFADGNFTFHSLAMNSTYFLRRFYMLLQSPQCNGTERSLLDCPGAVNVSVSRDICDTQDTVGMWCWGANPDVYGANWHGIEMFNATVYALQIGNVVLNVSKSVLEYVDIEYAGVNSTGHSAAALSASPFAPILQNVTFQFNAYDGVNYSYITSPAFIRDCYMYRNRGNGVNVTTAIGYVFLDRTRAVENGGDGARIKVLKYLWQDVELFYWQQALCPSSTTPGVPATPRFPMMVLGAAGTLQAGQAAYLATGNCSTTFSAEAGQVITAVLSSVQLDPVAQAEINVTDTTTGQLLASWYLDVPTYYQSVTSTFNRITITMRWFKPRKYAQCPTYFPCAQVVLILHANKTVQPEIGVRDSRFERNLLRGVHVLDMSSYALVNNTQFVRNGYDAGLKFQNGSGDMLINASTFYENEDSGLNISYSGGYRIINSSKCSTSSLFFSFLSHSHSSTLIRLQYYCEHQLCTFV